MDDIRGMLLPLPTVFDENGQLDETTLRQMIDYYVNAGINAMFVGGSMGQGMAMTQDERKRLFDIAASQIRGRIPMVAHVGTADPYSTIDLGRHALKAGATALAMVGPYYYSDRTPAELRAHFRLVGKSLSAPILLYNNPKYQGYPISGELMAQLRDDVPQIFGCKLAKGGVDELVAYRGAMGQDFKLFAMASSLFPGIRLGLTGTVSPPLTLCPEIGVACLQAIASGNDARALELQTAIIDLQGALISPTLRKICGRGVYLVGLRELGFPIKMYPRWPVAEVPQEGVEKIRAVLRTAREAIGKKAAA